LLYERSFSHTGLLQAGYFYKDLTEPIAYEQFYSTATFPHVPPGTRVLVTQPINAGSAYVQGFEIGFQQRLAYLPGVLGGVGISANYSHTSSTARDLPGRSDQPALLRDAPNTWNISPTYDTKKFSMRVGMTYDDAMIYAYMWQDGADSVGVHGPVGDNYLYAHFQFDTQASYRLPGGFEVYGYGLNLNNEVFGFYNGSPKYVVQREYYHPTYAGGLRWTPSGNR
jgi:outer membrane receptor protein involved in Fe transport